MSTKLNIAFLDASTVGKVNAVETIAALGKFTSYELTKPE